MELEFVGPSNLSNSINTNPINNKNAMMNEETTTPIFLTIVNSANHPIICIFHVLFKLLSFLSFIFGPIFFSIFSKNSFILSFFLTTILLSLDFWTVKNVTGRILIGMRWWYEVSKNGETIWMFESYNDSKNNNVVSSNTDRSIFWITTYLWTILWITIFFLQFFSLKLQWISLSVIAITLSSSNLIGYTKCLRSSNSQKDWITNLAVRTIINNSENLV